VVKFTSENAPKKTITKANRKPGRRKRRLKMPTVSGGAPASKSAGNRRLRKVRAVVLIGFMGAGKSSVGRILGKQLGWTFEDLDERIERRERRTVPEIFRDFGEAEFRRVEHAALRELLGELRAGAGKVVALGGGAFAQNHNAGLIEAANVPTMFLDASAEELWRRCKKQAERERIERPLLGSLASFRELYQARRPHYLRAAFRQETSGKTVEEIAAELAHALGLTRSESGGRRGEK
jgi:shikimate kinase